MAEISLNDKDKALLALCRDKPQSVNKLAALLNISPASVSIKIKKLESEGFLEICRRGKGKKTIVKSIKQEATTKYMKQILNKIKQAGGSISFEEFTTTPDLYFGAEDYLEKSKANFAVLYSNFVEKRVNITSEGLKFLKENKS